MEVNGSPVIPFQALAEANRIAGRNGVGIGIHTVENRFVGIKSRGVYESPGDGAARSVLRVPASTHFGATGASGFRSSIR